MYPDDRLRNLVAFGAKHFNDRSTRIWVVFGDKYCQIHCVTGIINSK